ncbi:NAD-dependent epimerase/dehydratase family protein [Cohnella rhizosphaerae]|uniref:NAD(P)-dependent oxidoreductase n=1 Tax=Cohnella rhizosphaerae TaxID=1457232 RepID=A0A9X4KVS9_9BACL|nr:NAD(P)-dependent oxidoreductase [Cohnella rhizosphaerae]MDG0811820.1 NAD(P)-dependent oxidoreductase [Cohnella rhizosphaerae]
MDALIGYSGFVGSNLMRQRKFDQFYRSTNIEEIEEKEFDTVICAGVSAVKWKANREPEEDWRSIENLVNHLKKMSCQKFILVSTVDVYANPHNITETDVIMEDSLAPYGKHRYRLEQFVTSKFSNTHIIRLPGLFGEGLKKNIIYDLLHHNAIDQIDSRNVFQFYDLSRLIDDIQIVVDNNLPIVNFATEPISVEEIARYAFDMTFSNPLFQNTVSYDMKSRYAPLFNNGQNKDYFLEKQEVLKQIRRFVIRNKIGGDSD